VGTFYIRTQPPSLHVYYDFTCPDKTAVMTPAKKTTTASADVSEKKKEYKYQQEISQMVRTWKTSPTLFPTVFGCFFADVRLR
jgi:hypothetical protein